MQEKIIKVIPGLMFLFCILGVLELFLIIEDMNKTENLEREVNNNLEAIVTITELLNKQLNNMDLEHFHNKKIKIK
ncbi:hypothetical protein ACLGD5_07395 [Helicobacter pylori]